MTGPFSPDAANDPRTTSERLKILESAIGQAAEAIIILEAYPADVGGRRIVYVNDAFTRITGYAREEALGETLVLLKGPDTDQDALDAVTAAYEAERPIRTELLNYRKDGSTFWAECDITCVKDSDGTLTHWISIQRDITRQKVAEQALEAMTRIQDSITDVFFVIDPAWHVTFANGQAHELLAQPGATLVGRDLRDVLPEEGRPSTLRELERAMREETVVQFETYHPRFDQWFKVYAYPLDHGLSIRWNDITEERMIKEALAESEDRFFHMADATAIMLWMSSDAGLTYLNRGWLNFTGRSLEEELDGGWVEGIHPDDLERCLATFAEVLETREPFHLEHRHRRVDGTYRWILAHGTPRHLPDGRFAGFIGSCLDVTEQKEAEAALRQSAESYRGLFDAITEAIFILDERGRFLDVNRGAVDMYGYPRDEMARLYSADLAAPGRNDLKRFRQRMRQAFEGTPQRFEWWGRRKSGDVFPVDAMLSRATYFGRDVVIGTARDISERVRYETELVEAKETAEEMARLKSSFLTNMSHEIRTPLTGILGLSEVLAEEAAPEHQELAQMIILSGQRLHDTLDSVLDLAQLESGSRQLDLAPFDLVEAAAQVAKTFLPHAARAGLDLQIHTPADPIFVVGDRSAFGRVVGNLLSNAVKFTPQGRISVTIHAEGMFGAVRVEDAGIGIDPAFLPHLFDEFRQESDGLNRSYEGAGIGLAISKRLVDLMHGEIHVDTEKGSGSAFTVHLPLSDAPPDSVG